MNDTETKKKALNTIYQNVYNSMSLEEKEVIDKFNNEVAIAVMGVCTAYDLVMATVNEATNEDSGNGSYRSDN